MNQTSLKLLMYFFAAPIASILIFTFILQGSHSNLFQNSPESIAEILTNIDYKPVEQKSVMENSNLQKNYYSYQATDFSSSTTRYRLLENNQQITNQRLFILLQTNQNHFHNFFTSIFNDFDKKNFKGVFFIHDGYVDIVRFFNQRNKP